MVTIDIVNHCSEIVNVSPDAANYRWRILGALRPQINLGAKPQT